MTYPVWRPSAHVIKNANITRFMQRHEMKTYAELIQRSTTGIEWFWDSCVHETNISWFEPYIQIMDASEGVPFAKWFLGGRLNIAYNCLDRHLKSKKGAAKTAVIWQGECGTIKRLTYAELGAQTNQTANYLKSIGIVRGDRVALFLPMLPELVSVFFAVLKIGAVVVPVFSGFGAESVTSRFNDATIKCVFTTDTTLRRGSVIHLKKILDEALENCPSVEKCVVIRRMGLDAVPMQKGRDVYFDDCIAGVSVDCECVELESEDRCMVLYTSGTTGRPKGTVHTHAGVLAQVTKELFFNFDLKPRDIFFWVADIGWMMGPWEIIGTTHFNATLVIIEGAPVFPKADRLLKLCQDESVTHLGVSPSLIRTLMRENRGVAKKYPLKKLRIIGSTGEPWDSESYKWCFEEIGKKRLPIVNISGGTEIMGCHLAPLIIHEISPCSLQSPGLGMAVDVFTDAGYPAPRGEVGYLVCKKPAPSMTKGFLNDRQRYLDTYYSKFRDVWNHGDWAVCDADGQWFIRGRADDTISIAGKRTGPAEVESCLSEHPFVIESCAVGIPDQIKGEALVCFVVIKKGIGITDFLLTDFKDWVAKRLGKSFKPSRVHVVAVLAKTRSGKIVRGTIKRKYLGQDLGDLSSLEIPETLDVIPLGC
ncbi:MAG: AMP-binding protein [Deltaproteobacteria bacterium]|nr:AMP-binding protein [Deltaproteobacteria bacterium]